MDRRRMLTLGGLAVGGAAALSSAVSVSAALRGDDRAAEHHAHGDSGSGGTDAQAVTPAPPVEPFSVAMPVPPVLRPTYVGATSDLYQIPVRAATVEILPGLATPVVGYNGQFVGPTIKARKGRSVALQVTNQLTKPTNVHLHGGFTPAAHDGHPMDSIAPGVTRTYAYPNLQHAATLWYHDHSHHAEAEHIYRGLHGFYLIEDDAEKALRLPSGQYDIPILLRDALIGADGSLVFDPTDGENRPTILANGKPQPYLRVAARRYRFRLLNASLHRIFRLRLDRGQMIQIGSDGGLLPAPVPVSEVKLTPGERVEVVIDFGTQPVGTRVVLENTSGPVIGFDVTSTATDDSRVPDQLIPLPALPTPTVTRDVALSFDPSKLAFTINGKTYDATRVDAQVVNGTTEIWRVTNRDTAFGIDHNFHLHLVQFRLLDRDGVPPTPGEAGWKDTVHIPPGSTVRVQATFAGFTGKYAFHCHFPEHSSFGMMAQFEVVNQTR
ncbi:Multicopper oxidase with three cupredoxin domains (includes cell division protein FtsP and spore coat protein CotA) [Micromonospora pallida]|uniref:Multicopper oxidase CueO n=1 Tax=Micromonospora pallida TaxID=145854 RepID=A0A1C6SSY1_9ACTN|nr:multicopper oxidase domain-containing protein [Micromonospora pallida]SCL32754.1 Multicopper oxidase with three cupredoxin domains (includes cell division protein FtsP and spore coat protein CotA) [Micromonospora pallida]